MNAPYGEPKDKKPSHEREYWHELLSKSTPRDKIAYAFMLIGIVLLFPFPILGGVIIGLVTGIYFYREIIGFIQNYSQFIHAKGVAKGFILAVLALALLITTPAIILGTAFALCLCILLFKY